MANYTMYLWEVLEMEGDTGNGLRIGLDRYPIFDPDYRDSLNRKIIEHYWNREIGMETISMFKLALSRRMNEIMPYWNQIYKTTLTELDPFSTVSLKTERDDETDESSTNTSDNTAKVTSTTGGRTINSDFPQSELSGNADYASSGADTNSGATTDTKADGSGTANSKSTGKGSSTTSGYQGSPADLVMKVRAACLNMDMLVINGVSDTVKGLDDCFMGIWDNGEEMLPYGSYGLYGIGMGY